MKKINYNNKPSVSINKPCFGGWDAVAIELNKRIDSIASPTKVLVVECYQGVIEEELVIEIKSRLQPNVFIDSREGMFPEDHIQKMVYPDVTDDRVFGYLTRLTLDKYFNKEKVNAIRETIKEATGLIILYGPGAAYVAEKYDVLVYADMARWEIQLRMRNHEVNNLGVSNKNLVDWMLLYKQGFFVDWRVCDRFKKRIFNKVDYFLDTNKKGEPKLVEGNVLREALAETVKRPFSVVPFFDPGPWGGQWMKEYCNLDKNAVNYAWCFNAVPEENSLLFDFNGAIFETPSINLVFFQTEKLLGEVVHARFGDEFPIRFDFLDTIDGGNLSLQVHPLTEYIQEKFGLHYTQDESYYMMEVKEDAIVYLGLKENINSDQMIAELEVAQESGEFDAEKFVEKWPVKKHDHVLIPAGTVHCSGKNSMVLEISATPYIFTFKLWDWGRVGLDGKPRPINIEHGKNVIKWDRTTKWVKEQLINTVQQVDEGEGWIEEKTGLHEREFIETRRHWFSQKVAHHTNGGVNVLCLVEGEEVIVESPSNAFEQFIVHYAEVFIVPAIVGAYTVTPHGPSAGKQCATMKAYVRV